MKYFLTIFFSIFAFFGVAFAASPTVNNAGFTTSNIWYSKDLFYAGEKVRVYTVIFNGSAYDLTGTVEFLDNGTTIGKTKFAISNGGRAQDLWVDWTAGEGKHTITARMADVVADGPDGKHAVSLPTNETGKSERVVEPDPVVKAAREKAEAEKAALARAEVFGKAESALQVVGDAVPAPVKEGATKSVNVLEEFRQKEEAWLERAREEKSREIAAIKKEEERLASSTRPTSLGGATDTMLNTAQKPLAYVVLAALTLFYYLFKWQAVFYGLLLYVGYRLVRWVVERVRNRQ